MYLKPAAVIRSQLIDLLVPLSSKASPRWFCTLWLPAHYATVCSFTTKIIGKRIHESINHLNEWWRIEMFDHIMYVYNLYTVIEENVCSVIITIIIIIIKTTTTKTKSTTIIINNKNNNHHHHHVSWNKMSLIIIAHWTLSHKYAVDAILVYFAITSN